MTPTDRVAYTTQDGLPQIDELHDAIDDMAELTAYWKRNRLKERVPVHIRAAIVGLANEIGARAHAIRLD